MIRIGMSTSSVYPLATEDAFRLARAAGFDGIEVMITEDPTTQDAAALATLAQRYDLPVLSVHAPVLLFAQFVWGSDPNTKLERSAALAAALGAATVVVHPPFRWQWGYARTFERTLRDLSGRFGVELAVENMFPWKIGAVAMRGYSPSPDPVQADVDAITLDFSHASLAGRDSLEYAMAMGDRLRHVHLCDGATPMSEGQILDEHMVPGRGTQPVAEVLQYLSATRWHGSLIAEVHTRSARSIRERLALLVETRSFAQRNLAKGREREAPRRVTAD